jgi:predicted HTH domain antitoxin
LKTLKIGEEYLRDLEEISQKQGLKLKDTLSMALKEGINILMERYVLDLYRTRSISLARAAEMLSVDIWEMVEKVRKAELHLDYGIDELREDMT